MIILVDVDGSEFEGFWYAADINLSQLLSITNQNVFDDQRRPLRVNIIDADVQLLLAKTIVPAILPTSLLDL